MLPALFLGEQRAWLMQQEYVAEQRSWLTRVWESAKRWRWSNCLLCVGLLIAVMGGFALLNVHDAIFSPLQYFLVRPPQIESLASSAIWASSHFGAHYTINFDFGSLNLIKSE